MPFQPRPLPQVSSPLLSPLPSPAATPAACVAFESKSPTEARKPQTLGPDALRSFLKRAPEQKVVMLLEAPEVAGLISITRGLFLAVVGQALTRPSPVRLRPGSGCSQAGGFDAFSRLLELGLLPQTSLNKLNGGPVILHSSHNGLRFASLEPERVQHGWWGSFWGYVFLILFGYFGFSPAWLQAPSRSVSQSVSRRARLSQSESQSVGQCLSVGQSSVEPRARQSVSQSVGASVGTRARRSVSRSVGRSVGAKVRAVSQSDSRSVSPPVCEIYDEPIPANEGACLRYRMNMDEPESLNEGAFSRHMMNRNHQIRGGVLKCLRCVVNRTHHMKARV